MDLARIAQLAGVILEAKQVEEKQEVVTETKSEHSKIEAHFVPKTMGQMGNIVVFDDCAAVQALAEFLRIPDGWKLTRVRDGIWAAHLKGDRLSFFDNERDYQSDEDEDEDQG